MFESKTWKSTPLLPRIVVSGTVHIIALIALCHLPRQVQSHLYSSFVTHAATAGPMLSPIMTARHDVSQTPKQPAVEEQPLSAAPLPLETPGQQFAAIPNDLQSSLSMDITPDMSEQTVNTRLVQIARLDVAPPETPAAAPFETAEVDREKPTASEMRAGRTVEPARPLKQSPLPAYPALARSARVQGDVVLEASISESGEVDDVTVIEGHPMLIQAAIDAVRHWRYLPARLNGIPARASVRITVIFKLQFQQ